MTPILKKTPNKKWIIKTKYGDIKITIEGSMWTCETPNGNFTQDQNLDAAVRMAKEKLE